jgi:hypothetical protein
MVEYSQNLALPSMRASVAGLGAAGLIAAAKLAVSFRMETGACSVETFIKWWCTLITLRTTRTLAEKSGSGSEVEGAV